MHYDANVQRKKLGWEPTLGTWQFRWSAVCRLLHIAPGGVEVYYNYCLPHIIGPGSRGVLMDTTSTSSHCTRRYYCNYYYCLPHFAPSGVEKWFPRRRSTNQGLHLCSPALSHQAASKVGLSQPIHAKNVWCCGEGYFCQKKFAEKVRKSWQNVNRDKSV